jgi:Protein of unknown function (DUF3223)
MITVGTLSFATKAAAVQHFREMLYRYAIGDGVGEHDAAELRALLERHPTYEQKRGPGIAGFAVTSAPFVLARRIEPDGNLLTPPADNQFGRSLRDRELATDWRAFHHELAHLRIVAADENVRRAKMALPRAIDRQLVLHTSQT